MLGSDGQCVVEVLEPPFANGRVCVVFYVKANAIIEFDGQVDTRVASPSAVLGVSSNLCTLLRGYTSQVPVSLSRSLRMTKEIASAAIASSIVRKKIIYESWS